MNNFEFKKIRSIINLQEKLQPKTYLDNLAESGWLDMYLNNYSKERFTNDKEYKERVFESMYNYSPEVNEDVEIYFLEQLCESMSYFIEYTKECRKQKLYDPK